MRGQFRALKWETRLPVNNQRPVTHSRQVELKNYHPLSVAVFGRNNRYDLDPFNDFSVDAGRGDLGSPFGARPAGKRSDWRHAKGGLHRAQKKGLK